MEPGIAEKLKEMTSKLPADDFPPTDTDCLRQAMEFATWFDEKARTSGTSPGGHVSPGRTGSIGMQWAGSKTAGRELYIAFRPSRPSDFYAVHLDEFESQGVFHEPTDMDDIVSWLLYGKMATGLVPKFVKMS